MVLDGVLDDSPAVLRVVAGPAPRAGAEHLPHPRGVVAALNDGFAQARGRVLIRCDDDLTPAPHMVRGHVEHHRDRDDVGVSCAMRDVVTDTPYSRTYGERDRATPARAVVRPAGGAAVGRLVGAQLGDQGGVEPARPRVRPALRLRAGQRARLPAREVGRDDRRRPRPRGRAPGRGAVGREPGSPGLRGRRLQGPVRTGPRRESRCGGGRTRDRCASARGPPGWDLVAWLLRDWSSYQRLGRVVEAWAPAPAAGRRGPARRPRDGERGRAGRLHGPTDLATLTTQKRRELDREREAQEPPSAR